MFKYMIVTLLHKLNSVWDSHIIGAQFGGSLIYKTGGTLLPWCSGGYKWCRDVSVSREAHEEDFSLVGKIKLKMKEQEK